MEDIDLLLRAVVRTNITSVNDKIIKPETIGDFYFPACYPNPFNSTVVFKVKINKTQNYSLSVFDNTGKIVKVIFNQLLTRGNYTYLWNSLNDAGINVSSGIYYAVLTSQSGYEVQKLMLIR